MVGHGGSSVGSYLANPTSPIPSHCASIVATSTLRVNIDIISEGLIVGYLDVFQIISAQKLVKSGNYLASD